MANIMRLGGGGGGGLEIAVVGGTTQPISPKDNTIWVNTGVEIGAVTFSPNSPDSPAVGDVWVNTGNRYSNSGSNASTNILAVSENPYLEINVFNISQWDGSVWVTKDNSAIYANGGWTTLALYLFHYGTLNEDYPILVGAANSPSVALVEGYASYGLSGEALTFRNTNTAQAYFALQFNKVINLANFNKATLVFSISGSATGNSVVRLGFGDKGINESATLNAVVGWGTADYGAPAASKVYTLELNLSSYATSSAKAAVAVTASSTGTRTVSVYSLCLTA